MNYSEVWCTRQFKCESILLIKLNSAFFEEQFSSRYLGLKILRRNEVDIDSARSVGSIISVEGQKFFLFSALESKWYISVVSMPWFSFIYIYLWDYYMLTNPEIVQSLHIGTVKSQYVLSTATSLSHSYYLH